MKWVGHAAYMVEMRNSYKSVVRKPGGKRSFGDLDIEERKY
jgi:hypothetical protein